MALPLWRARGRLDVMLKAGIVGLPNVGKSSLFNALTAQRASADNYPFCTVEPNVGIVAVPDSRLDRIFQLVEAPERVPTAVQFVDIAGLVAGASEGEGLGNKFLGNIREVDAVVHVLRCFNDSDVTHVLGSLDPARDREIVNIELALADLETVERRLEQVERKARSGEQEARREAVLLERLQRSLLDGVPLRRVALSAADQSLLEGFHLVSRKAVLYVANIAESELREGEGEETVRLREILRAEEPDARLISISSAVEAELAELDREERSEFLEELGLREPGLDRLVRATYELLGLITFFTTGEKEARAWTVRRGALAPEAAGKIHTDFERGFIRAETIGYAEFDRIGSLKAARERGLIRSEGKDYEVRDGELIQFHFNV